jgi:hypothetical protein
MSEHRDEHRHSHIPDVVIDDAVIIQIAKLHLEAGDTVWVKVADTVPFVRDWESLHLLQHSLQEVLDGQYPALDLLVIVAPGDAEPIILHPPDEEEDMGVEDLEDLGEVAEVVVVEP